MNDDKIFKSLNDRIAFVQREVDSLSLTSNHTFADRVLFNSMDSHLSDLLEEKRHIESRHPLVDFMELRLRGALVDFGTIPLELLSALSGSLAGLIQKATHRISSGKDSSRVPQSIRTQLDMRLADLTPGSTRLAITFSTGSCELVDTVSSHAVKEIFSLLGTDNDVEFISKIADIGTNSAASLQKIAQECEKNNLNFDLSWVGPLSNGKRHVSLNNERLRKLSQRLMTTHVSKPYDEIITGELALLSMFGKLEIVNEFGKFKCSYPIEMLGNLQSKYKVGERVSVIATVTEIHNERLNYVKKNLMIKSFQ